MSPGASTVHPTHAHVASNRPAPPLPNVHAVPLAHALEEDPAANDDATGPELTSGTLEESPLSPALEAPWLTALLAPPSLVALLPGVLEPLLSAEALAPLDVLAEPPLPVLAEPLVSREEELPPPLNDPVPPEDVLPPLAGGGMLVEVVPAPDEPLSSVPGSTLLGHADMAAAPQRTSRSG